MSTDVLIRCTNLHPIRGWTVADESGDMRVFQWNEGGADVILLHGNGLHSHMWKSWVPALADDGLGVFTVDLPGHGNPGSDINLRLLTLESMAETLVQAAELIDRRFDVVAHSAGAAVAAFAMQKSPSRFRRGVLLEPVMVPPPRRGEFDNDLADRALRRRDRWGSLSEVWSSYIRKEPFSSWPPAVLGDYLAHGFDLEADGTVTLSCRREVESHIYRLVLLERSFEALAEVADRAWIVFAPEAKSVVNKEIQTVIQSAMPVGHCHPMPWMTHFGPMEKREQCLAYVLACLSGSEAETTGPPTCPLSRAEAGRNRP